MFDDKRQELASRSALTSLGLQLLVIPPARRDCQGNLRLLRSAWHPADTPPTATSKGRCSHYDWNYTSVRGLSNDRIVYFCRLMTAPVVLPVSMLIRWQGRISPAFGDRATPIPGTPPRTPYQSTCPERLVGIQNRKSRRKRHACKITSMRSFLIP